MKKILLLSLALLSVVGTQAAEYTNGFGGINTSHKSTGITDLLKKAIKSVDPKKPENVAKLHEVKAKALLLLGQTHGIIAPEAQTQLASVISSLGSEESLFILGQFLMAILVQVETYRAQYHHGMGLGPIPKKTNRNSHGIGYGTSGSVKTSTAHTPKPVSKTYGSGRPLHAPGYDGTGIAPRYNDNRTYNYGH